MANMGDYLSRSYFDTKSMRELQREMERQMASIYQIWPGPAPATSTAPAPIPGKTLLVIGAYMLKHDAPSFVLYRDTTKITTWLSCPTRSVMAATIWWDRQQRPLVNAKDDFGYLLGVRYFGLSDDFHLRSPHQNTVWESNVLTVGSWSEEETVRGKAGIHAAWPTRSGHVTPRIDSDVKDALSLIAKVRGLGRFVKGEMGWRAEKAIIDTVYLPSSLLGRWRVVKRLEKLYPEIIFEEETWTLERSSRSVK